MMSYTKQYNDNIKLLKHLARLTQKKNPEKCDEIEDEDGYHTTRGISYYNNPPKKFLGKNLETLLIQKQASSTNPLLILDIGCGVGNCVKDLLDRGYNAFGLDIRPYKNRIGNHFIVGNAQEADKLIDYNGKILGIPDNTFDVIISLYAISHMEKKEAPIIQANRMLKKGGIALLDYCFLREECAEKIKQSIYPSQMVSYFESTFKPKELPRYVDFIFIEK